jgi:cell division control protein 11
MTVACYRMMLTSTTELELDEEGTRISLTIVDTPGFGDQIDNEAR